MQGVPDRFGAGLSLTLSPLVQIRDLFEGESECDHLGRLRASPGTSATAFLQCADVVSGLSFRSPGLDLFLGDRSTVDRLVLVDGIIV